MNLDIQDCFNILCANTHVLISPWCGKGESCGVDWTEASDCGAKIGKSSPAETEATKSVQE